MVDAGRPADSRRCLPEGSEPRARQRIAEDEGGGPHPDSGTLGYDVSFIRVIPTSTGRTIKFVTNRKISFGEAYADSQSQSFDLTAGQFELNDQDKSKSTGVLYPACQFTINKDGELQIELNQ